MSARSRTLLLATAFALGAPAGCNLWVSLDGYGRGRDDSPQDAQVSGDADAGDERDAFSEGDGSVGEDASVGDVEAGDGAEADVEEVDVAEDAGCSDGQEEPCYGGPDGTLDEGVCRAGTRSCSLGVWQPCVGDVKPSTEVCNDRDDDCDGTVDEALTTPCYTGPAGTAGQGPCKAGIQTCSQGQWGACVGETTPASEDCNGLDDDCDGTEDDFSGPQPCYEGPSGTAGVGPCLGGLHSCVLAEWTACDGQVLPSPEVCDGVDNDCNTVDDDEPLDINDGVACGQQCLTTSNDSDCDGLVGSGSQDLWPSFCNPLLFTDRFSVAPTQPTWLSSGVVSQSCGRVRLEPDARLSVVALPPGITAPDYLAETRVTFAEAPPAGTDWSVGITSALQGTTQHRACEVFVSGTTGEFAFLRVVVYDGTNSGSHTDLVFQVDQAEGDAYMLQSYGTASEHHCRLLSPSGKSLLNDVHQASGTVVLQSPGTVSVHTRGRAAFFDYVRVFDVP